MEPIHFKEETTVLAKTQPQYRVLPISVRLNDERAVVKEMVKYNFSDIVKMTCKYEFSDLELQQIIKTKSIFISQFGDCYHPIYPQTDSPFLVLPIEYKVNEDKTFNFYIPMADQTIMVLEGIALHEAIDTILKSVTDVTAEQLHFKLKPSLGVDGDGNLKMM